MGMLAKLRLRGGNAVELLFTLAGVVLLVGVLMVVLNAEERGPVRVLFDVADFLDLGIFDRYDGIVHWSSENAQQKNALFNWGLGAVAWLLAGRLVSRLSRPRVSSK